MDYCCIKVSETLWRRVERCFVIVGEPFLVKLSLNSWPRPCSELTGLRIRFHLIQILFPCGLHLRMPPMSCRNLNVKPGVWLNVSSGIMIVSFLDSYWWELLSFSQKGLVVHGSRWSALRLMSWFLTWCDSHGGGGRSLRLHLCASPPKTCSCTDGQKEREFHSESWRRITRKNVTQGDLSWNLPEAELKNLGTLVDDFRWRTAGTVRKRGKATPYTGQGKWEAGTRNRELQEASKKVKFEAAHDNNKGDARSLSWLDTAPTNTLEETRGENMATINAEASAAARGALASPFSPTSSPSECQPSPSAEVTSKEADSGCSSDALCKEHPHWNQVLAEKLHHVRNMEELDAVLEEALATLAMVPTHLGAYVSHSKGADKSPAGELEFGDEHQVWARGGIHCLNFGQASGLTMAEFASQGKSEVVRQIWKEVEQWWGWTWIVVLSLATLHSTLFFARSHVVKCNGAVLCPLQVL